MGAIDSDSEEDLRPLPQEKAYVLAISDAVKHVTGDCDATRYFQPIHFKARLDGPDTPPFSCDQPTLAAPRDGLRPLRPLAMRAPSFRFMCKSQIL
jgi:hypothetical protein